MSMLSESRIYAYVPVKHIERARKFYDEMLDLGHGDAVGPGFTFTCAGETGFFLYPSPGAGTNKASTAFWQVADCEAVVKWLQARGVEFETYDMPGGTTSGPGNVIFEGGGAKAAWFKDTEGNILAVVQSSP